MFWITPSDPQGHALIWAPPEIGSVGKWLLWGGADLFLTSLLEAQGVRLICALHTEMGGLGGTFPIAQRVPAADVSEGSAVRQVVLLSAAAAALFKATVSQAGWFLRLRGPRLVGPRQQLRFG